MTRSRAGIAAAFLVAGGLIVPTIAPAKNGADDNANANASKACQKLRNDLGAGTFKLTYGTNKNRANAFGKCVSKQAKVDDQSHSNAAKDCKSEQAADKQAFDDKYGTNPSKSNAYGKCVSQKAKDDNDQHHDAVVNAAKACKSERSTDAAAFKQKYGTNVNKSNAFGKCVSSKAKTQHS